jgi:hypothetical protein
VARRNTGIRGARPASRRPTISPARLDALIDEAIVDAYDESEQAVGFHATIEQHLALPFETVVLGVAVTVKKVDVAIAGASDKPSRFSSYRYPIRSRPAGSGSRRIVDGPRAAGRGGSRR